MPFMSVGEQWVKNGILLKIEKATKSSDIDLTCHQFSLEDVVAHVAISNQVGFWPLRSRLDDCLEDQLWAQDAFVWGDCKNTTYNVEWAVNFIDHKSYKILCQLERQLHTHRSISFTNTPPHISSVSYMIYIASRNAFGGFTFAPIRTKNIPVVVTVMINPSLRLFKQTQIMILTPT